MRKSSQIKKSLFYGFSMGDFALWVKQNVPAECSVNNSRGLNGALDGGKGVEEGTVPVLDPGFSGGGLIMPQGREYGEWNTGGIGHGSCWREYSDGFFLNSSQLAGRTNF
jgi:hypothetical protein